MMTALDMVALLLPADDREAMLGDLEEQKQPEWLRLFAVLGFVIRQQVEYWRDWRPWLVGVAVIPATLHLLGASFQLSLDFRDLLHGGGFGMALLYQVALMTAWAGTGGFVIGALLPRTGWISPLLFIFPCFSCLMEFPGPALKPLPVAVCPARHCGRDIRAALDAYGVGAVAGPDVRDLWPDAVMARHAPRKLAVIASGSVSRMGLAEAE